MRSAHVMRKARNMTHLIYGRRTFAKIPDGSNLPWSTARTFRAENGVRGRKVLTPSPPRRMASLGPSLVATVHRSALARES